MRSFQEGTGALPNVPGLPSALRKCSLWSAHILRQLRADMCLQRCTSKASVWPCSFHSRNVVHDTVCDFSVTHQLLNVHCSPRNSLLPLYLVTPNQGFAKCPLSLPSLQSCQAALDCPHMSISVLVPLRRFHRSWKWHRLNYSQNWMWHTQTPQALWAFRRI